MRSVLICLIAIFIINIKGFSFTESVVIDFPVDEVIYDSYHDNFIVISNNTLYFLEIGQNKSGIHFTNKTVYPYSIDGVNVNKYGNMCVMTNSTAMIYVQNMLFNVIKLNYSWSYGGWLNNYFDCVIIATDLDDIKENKTSTLISYYNYHGTLFTNFTLGFRLWDVLINPVNDNIVFDSFIIFEPAVYVGEANIGGVTELINTTNVYPSSGLAVLGDYIMFSDYYHGINVYNVNGTKLYEIPAVGNMNLQVYTNQQYLAYSYLKKQGKNYISPIEFIDFKGNVILTVNSPSMLDPGVILFDSHGNMITYDIGYIQVYYVIG